MGTDKRHRRGSSAESSEDETRRDAVAVAVESDAGETLALAAAELASERLFPGDTIEYYSMAFVFGDPRGHRLAKVLRIRSDDDEYPLRLDSQEMLPLTQMIKRKLSRRGEAIGAGEAMWRKIRTFDLIDGKVKGKTRADALNAGIKKAISDAMKATGRRSANEKAALNTHAISSFFKPKPATPRDEPPSDTRRDDRSSTRSPARKDRGKVTQSSFVRSDRSKSVLKRPRIDLTPPSKEQRRQSSQGLASSSQRSKSPRCDDPSRQPKPKKRIQEFINRIKDEQRDFTTSLDAYLDLDKKKQELEQELHRWD
ncbi:hypothetical protein P43SY_006118 [Pythium insidiosum]|uniref:Uncharacterized protein n=1 Tax=Pythium insidiosum TaxID=114742 RepID=A0AAD5QA77_PYTIN|nr:hypothetical protein P43SY_006118 [Pythium insidiosum]